jgi:paraquat-inducible protein B
VEDGAYVDAHISFAFKDLVEVGTFAPSSGTDARARKPTARVAEDFMPVVKGGLAFDNPHGFMFVDIN